MPLDYRLSWHYPPKQQTGIQAYILAAMAPLLVGFILFPSIGILNGTNTIMLFLLEVFLCALWLGKGPTLLAAITSVLLFDAFFALPPPMPYSPPAGSISSPWWSCC